MDRAALGAKLDRLVAQRGDPVLGLPSAEWAASLEGVDRDLLLHAAIVAVRELVIPEWAERRRDDMRPQRALEAAEGWLAARNADTLGQAKAAAKACTAARNDTFGYEHRVAEAARAVAWAASDKDATPIFNAIACVEEELLARIALTGEYHRGPEQRRALVDVLRKVFLPPEPVVEAPPIAASPPVPYSADIHFDLGQRIVHKKFGDLVVTSVGETWVEVELSDGTRKRLTHKP